MVEEIKTVTAGVSGVGVWWIESLAPTVQLCVSLLTLVYIFLKVKKELK